MHPFDRWPRLDLPRVRLGSWPTPIRPVPFPGLAERFPGLAEPVWVKDEGACCAAYGGNKVRKLELLLADAVARGRRDLLTIGAVGSHHVLATAILGARFGLRTHAVLFPQPDQPHAREVGAAIAARCASIAVAPSLAAIPAAWTAAWGRIAAGWGGRPYRIPVGGSNALGTVGWIGAGLELADAIAAGAVPEPARVFVPLGSGGTAAGLWAGLRLGGVGSEIVAVRVAGREVGNRINLERLARGALARLRGAGAPVGEVRLDGLRIAHGWIGDGYGTADGRAAEALERGAAAGLALERTYSGRALAACLAEARRGGRTMFVQTVSQRPVPPAPPLPARLEELLQAE